MSSMLMLKQAGFLIHPAQLSSVGQPVHDLITMWVHV